ncbi:MAG TPA: 3-isopropylmalate dehydratase small subunit [Vicinamibacterales bacterium]
MAEALRITRVEGRGLPMRGDDIDTDRIIPARFLRSVTFDGLEKYLFVDERAGSPAAVRAHGVHPFDDPHFQGASVLLVNSNFGCGSSREHAPQALQRWGIRAVVGESFSEIFFGNAAMIGLPCVKAAADDVRTLMDQVERTPQTAIHVDLTGNTVETEGFSCVVTLPSRVREALVTGAWDTTGLLLDRYGEVDKTAAALPYIRGF